MDKILPDFYIVGAAKSGTTSIYHYLRQHPKVYLPLHNKEPHFHSREYFQSLNKNVPMTKESFNKFIFEEEKYYKLYKNKKDNQITGDASTGYLWDFNNAITSIKEMHNNVSNPKIIILLRNPIDRAFSAYNQLRLKGYEKKSFYESLMLEEKRMEEKWHPFYYYVQYGLYFNQVQAYIKNFDQVKIILYDDLKSNTLEILNELCDFLDIFQFSNFNTEIVYNKTGNVRMNFINNIVKPNSILRNAFRPIIRHFTTIDQRRMLLEKIRIMNLKPTKISSKDKSLLLDIFRSDIYSLELLLNRKLTNWYL